MLCNWCNKFVQIVLYLEERDGGNYAESKLKAHKAGYTKGGYIGTKAPNGCESSGAKHNRARMFLTRYQVIARHPRAESLRKR